MLASEKYIFADKDLTVANVITRINNTYDNHFASTILVEISDKWNLHKIISGEQTYKFIKIKLTKNIVFKFKQNHIVIYFIDEQLHHDIKFELIRLLNNYCHEFADILQNETIDTSFHKFKMITNLEYGGKLSWRFQSYIIAVANHCLVEFTIDKTSRVEQIFKQIYYKKCSFICYDDRLVKLFEYFDNMNTKFIMRLSDHDNKLKGYNMIECQKISNDPIYSQFTYFGITFIGDFVTTEIERIIKTKNINNNSSICIIC